MPSGLVYTAMSGLVSGHSMPLGHDVQVMYIKSGAPTLTIVDLGVL